MNNLSIKGILHIIIIFICMLSSQSVLSQTNTPKRLSSEDIVVAQAGWKPGVIKEQTYRKFKK